MPREVKRIDIRAFQELGFLQEANRLFFHPLGLALEIVIDKECWRCGGSGNFDDRDSTDERLCPKCEGSGELPESDWKYTLGGVWDYRTDPEGILYGAGEIEAAKIKSVGAERGRHRQARERLLGKGRNIQRLEDVLPP